MARPLLVAAVAAVALGGCGGGAQSTRAPAPAIALGFGQEIASLDQQLAGVQRGADDVNTRKAATDLWRETTRTARELTQRIDAEGSVGGSLIVAAEEARVAAHTLQPPRDDPLAAVHLNRSAAALLRAANALAPRLPRSDAPILDELRTALPPG